MADSTAAILRQPGFADPVHDSQQTFRAVLAAMSRPGAVVPLPRVLDLPEGMPAGALAVLLTLADLDTPVWPHGPAAGQDLAAWLSFACGCPLAASPEEAAYALMDIRPEGAGLDPAVLARLPAGTPEYPDRGATVIVAVAGMDGGCGARVSGPGVRGEGSIRVPGTDAVFWEYARGLGELFPLGLDFIFASRGEVVCLPRSARIGEILCM